MHDLDLAARYADRLLVMKDGAIVADAPPEAVIRGPVLSAVFGVARGPEGWRLVSPSEDRRSSP
jgi:iron complex transport system ATP-binding protein